MRDERESADADRDSKAKALRGAQSKTASLQADLSNLRAAHEVSEKEHERAMSDRWLDDDHKEVLRSAIGTLADPPAVDRIEETLRLQAVDEHFPGQDILTMRLAYIESFDLSEAGMRALRDRVKEFVGQRGITTPPVLLNDVLAACIRPMALLDEADDEPPAKPTFAVAQRSRYGLR